MKKLSFLLIVLSVLLCSCEQADCALVPVRLYVNSEKSFTFEEENLSYRYKSVGESGSSDWQDISFDNGSADIGYFSQGKWTFYVEQYGQSGVVYEGSSDCFITRASVKNVDICMKRVITENSFEALFSVSCPCDNPSSCEIVSSYMKIGDGQWLPFSNWARRIQDNKALFTNKKDLTTGYYLFRFSYYVNHIQIGGESFSVYLDREQRINGEIISGIEISDDAIVINDVTQSITAKAGTVKTFVFRGTSDSYKWYVNQVLQEGFDSAVFTLYPQEGQTYNVECRTSSGNKSCTVVSPSSVYVNPETYRLYLKNASYICKGFALKDDPQKTILDVNYIAKSYVSNPSSFNDLDIEPVIVSSSSQALASETLYIGGNANLFKANENQNWLGQSILNSAPPNTTVKTIFVFKNIEEGCFTKLNGLRTLYIMDGVTTIGDTALFGLSSLNTVSISSTVTRIEDTAFYNCTGISNLVIPDSVMYVGFCVFKGWTGSQTISINSANSYHWDEDWAYSSNARIVRR